jgi:hypothetical protein
MGHRHENPARDAAVKRAAERKAKHDAPHAARILFDPFTFDPFGPVAGAARGLLARAIDAYIGAAADIPQAPIPPWLVALRCKLS